MPPNPQSVAAAQWANDCSPGVSEVLSQTLVRLQQLGAAVVDITLPDLDLVQVRLSGQRSKMPVKVSPAAGFLTLLVCLDEVGCCRSHHPRETTNLWAPAVSVAHWFQRYIATLVSKVHSHM
jgi:hypothetical protein